MDTNQVTNMSPVVQAQSLSILVTDNDLRMRESLRDLLEAYDLSCVVAKNEQQVLDLMNHKHFDLVLLDLNGSEANSLQVLDIIKLEHPDTDFIVFSSNASFSSEQIVEQLGVSGVLVKPFDPKILISLIKSISESRILNRLKVENSSFNTLNTLSDVEKTLQELEDIIQTEELHLTNDIINASPVVAFVWNNSANWPVQFVSENVVNLLGYPANEFITGKVNYNSIIHPDDIEQVNRDMISNKQSLQFTHKPYRFITRNGMVKWVEDTSTVVRNEQGDITHYQGILIDVTKRELARQKMLKNQLSLEHIAHHDPLTGLPNRILLLDRLKQSIKKIKRIKKHTALLYIDLDKFKEINDSLGHIAGDEVLKSVAKRLLSSVRAIDTVARIGGDEFIVIMESVSDINDVKKVVEKLNHSLQQSVHFNMHELFVTSSIGISLSPDDSEDPEELIKKADIAMYRSKQEGRNTYHFYQTSEK